LGEAHKKLEEKPPAEPAQENQADRYFEQAVKAFEAGDYAAATTKFHDALELAPDDIVLPFAYVQALFASGEYEKAAEFLRKALIKTSPQEEGVFYPRGLYPDDSVLQQQVEQLDRAVRLNRSDSDLELLLGYQLLGMGRYDEAAGHLQNALLDSDNSQAATVLMSLLEKLIKANNNNVDSNQK
jgi:tetratricopeptide (TPR) repeat protein